MNVAEKFDWSPKALERLRQLADGTRSATEIGETMGCGRNAVIGKIHRMAKAGKAEDIKLMPGSGSRGKGWSRTPKGERKAKPRPEPVSISWANGKRLAPKKGKPTDPVFLGVDMGIPISPDEVAPSLPPIPSDHALTLPPMGFAEAMDRNRCLYFAGDPYSPAGPDMPVCGAERPEWIGDRSRYCVRHRLLQYAPRDRAGDRAGDRARAARRAA